MNHNVSKITDGAMMTAIVGVFLLIDRLTGGFLSGSVMFVLPLPMVFFGVKYGWKDSFMVAFAMTVIAVMLSSPAGAVTMLAEAMIGMVFGCGIKNGTETKKLYIETIMAAVLVDVLTMIVFGAFFGYDMAEEARERKTAFSSAFDQAGVSADSAMIDNMLKAVIPASVIFTGIMEGAVTILLSRMLLKRLRIAVPKSTPFLLYMPPKWTGYVGIFGFVVLTFLLNKPLENEALNTGLEALGVMAMMYLGFYGAICVMILMRKYLHAGRFAMVIGALLSVFMGGWVVPLLGYFYITTDLHQRLLKGGSNASENQ